METGEMSYDEHWSAKDYEEIINRFFKKIIEYLKLKKENDAQTQWYILLGILKKQDQYQWKIAKARLKILLEKEKVEFPSFLKDKPSQNGGGISLHLAGDEYLGSDTRYPWEESEPWKSLENTDKWETKRIETYPDNPLKNSGSVIIDATLEILRDINEPDLKGLIEIIKYHIKFCNKEIALAFISYLKKMVIDEGIPLEKRRKFFAEIDRLVISINNSKFEYSATREEIAKISHAITQEFLMGGTIPEKTELMNSRQGILKILKNHLFNHNKETKIVIINQVSMAIRTFARSIHRLRMAEKKMQEELVKFKEAIENLKNVLREITDGRQSI